MGVKLMTFDSCEEATKIHSVYPDAELVFRIAQEETNAPGPMGKKFGAPSPLWLSILKHCMSLNLKVRGVSFHVGTGGCSFEAYEVSLKNAEKVFTLAKQIGMPPLDLLDIGGGYSDNATNYFNINGEDVFLQKNKFSIVAPKINHHLKEIFPGKNSNVKVIGEPGRYMCTGSGNIVAQIYLKKQVGDNCHYYINNGVYQGLACSVIDKEYYRAELLVDEATLK